MSSDHTEMVELLRHAATAIRLEDDPAGIVFFEEMLREHEWELAFHCIADMLADQGIHESDSLAAEDLKTLRQGLGLSRTESQI
jgi:hypothetical protein